MKICGKLAYALTVGLVLTPDGVEIHRRAHVGDPSPNVFLRLLTIASTTSPSTGGRSFCPESSPPKRGRI
jgi:hypothetical protein